MAQRPLSRDSKASSNQPAPAPALIVYGTDEQCRADCARVAGARHVAYVEVRNLHAACTALTRYPGSLVIVCSPIRPWDHEVLMDRAAQSQAMVRLVEPMDDLEAICEDARLDNRSQRPSTLPPRSRGTSY